MHTNRTGGENAALKIYTPSGFVRASVFGRAAILDVGCGQRKLPGAVGMDIVADSMADIVHDMDRTPWPFAGDTFDIILLNHVLEHAKDALAVLAEAHRVGKAGGRVVIQVPYFRSVDAFADPTHRRFFTSGSLDYVIRASRLAEYRYMPALFEKMGFWYGWPHPSANPLRQLLKKFMERYPRFYDQYLSLLFPVACLTWELKIVKE